MKDHQTGQDGPFRDIVLILRMPKRTTRNKKTEMVKNAKNTTNSVKQEVQSPAEEPAAVSVEGGRIGEP